MSPLTKPQKLLLIGNGFLGGLAAIGVTELQSRHLDFEPSFLKSWGQWSPSKPKELLPQVEFAGTNEPRMILFRIKRSSSPFKDFADVGINPLPYGQSPRDFLEDHCDELPVEEWISLAKLFEEARNWYASLSN